MAMVMSHSALNFHSSSPSPGTSYPTSPVIVAFTVGVLICFLAGFFCIYICRCCFMHHLYAWIFDHHRIDSPAATASIATGLDTAMLQNFPVFPYLSLKECQGKNSNNKECAICLLEFEEHSLLRLLTVCRHVFHQECIDLWLESHKTCPVCRTDLEETKFPDDLNQIRMEENDLTNYNDEICIDVREEEGEVVSERRFARSHSTGHSMVRSSSDDNNGDDEKEDEDKYTLKLPEHVEVKLARGHILASRSCSSYGEMTRICNKCSYAEAISGSS